MVDSAWVVVTACVLALSACDSPRSTWVDASKPGTGMQNTGIESAREVCIRGQWSARGRVWTVDDIVGVVSGG